MKTYNESRVSPTSSDDNNEPHKKKAKSWQKWGLPDNKRRMKTKRKTYKPLYSKK